MTTVGTHTELGRGCCRAESCHRMGRGLGRLPVGGDPEQESWQGDTALQGGIFASDSHLKTISPQPILVVRLKLAITPWCTD